MKISKLGLLAILLFGLLLRLIWIDRFPPGFTPDEAAFGYNAYSLLKTGRDEWGTPFFRLPFSNLKSFGDYKLPLYTFLAVPTIGLFGLTEFATRLPNALFGSLSILSLYLLTKKLFPQAALTSAFLAAISPWSIQLSRGAFEANLVTFLLPLALYLFFSHRPILTALSLALSFYSYHSGRFLVLLYLPVLIAFHKSKKTAYCLLLTLLLIFPGLYSLFASGSVRTADLAITSPTDNWQSVADRRFAARISGLPDPLARLFSNKLIFVLSQFTRNYLSYLSPQFLFTDGAGEGTYGMLPGRGVLYFVDIVSLIFLTILSIKSPRPYLPLLLLLFFLSPLPAALSKGPGLAANRAATMQPFIIIMLALGFQSLHSRIKTALIIAYVLSVVFFLEDYFYHSPYSIGKSMFIGYRELFTRSLNLSSDYSQVKFSRSLSEPHIYLAFFSQFSPRLYQKSSSSWPDFQKLGFKFLDQYNGYTIGKFYFGDLDVSSPAKTPALYIGKYTDFPFAFPEHFHLNYPDGSRAYKVSAQNP